MAWNDNADITQNTQHTNEKQAKKPGVNTAIDGGITSQNPNPSAVEPSSPVNSGSPSYDKLTNTLDSTPVTSFAETGFGAWNKNLTFAGLIINCQS